jgi:hypothetical protein
LLESLLFEAGPLPRLRRRRRRTSNAKMPLRLDIKKKLSTRTDRVKSVDLHPSEPWVLIGLYTGHLQIWNYEVSLGEGIACSLLRVSAPLFVLILLAKFEEFSGNVVK